MWIRLNAYIFAHIHAGARELFNTKKNAMEKHIERHFIDALKSIGGKALKFVSPNYAGMPDRLVLMPNGRIFFVELKAPGKKPRKLQLVRHQMLRDFGFKVYVVDSIEKIGEVISEIQSI